MEVLSQIEEGIKVEAIQHFQQQFHLTVDDMAFLLVVSRKGYYNLLKQKKLNKQKSERFLMVTAVYEQAETTLESIANIDKWMHTYHAYLERIPFTILDTYVGCNEVRSELIRLDHGVVS